MKKFIKKPLKDWNLIDMGIATVGAIALIPVGFFSHCRKRTVCWKNSITKRQ